MTEPPPTKPVRDGDNAPSPRRIVLFAVVLVVWLIVMWVVLVVIGDGNDAVTP